MPRFPEIGVLTRTPELVRFRLDRDTVLGVMAAIPFAYPSEPFYWVAILAFLLAVPGFRFDRPALYRLALVFAMWLVILLTALAVPIEYSLNVPSVFGSLLTFALFLFALGVRQPERFFDGFLLVVTVYALSTFVFFVTLGAHEHGVLLFVDSQLRLWGEGYLPEWPNVFCAFLCIGYLVYWMRDRWIMACFMLAAALLTTSRIALVALACSLLFDLLNRHRIPFWLALVTAGLLGLSALMLIGLPPDYVEQRLLKVTDRMIILSEAWRVFSDNLFGIGNISFAQLSDYYASYHSSFLKVLVRYGIIGLAIFLLIVKPRRLRREISSKVNALLLFMLMIGVFQDMLLHMHFVLVYAVLLRYREHRLGLDTEVSR